jgi:CheY-like chemotaxis protein
MPGAELLLVEDDRDEIDVALRALERSGVDATVAVARDGVEALEALGLESDQTPARLPRVVFLDLKMSRVDGWEVLRRMRADPRTSDIPVVVISSSDRRVEKASSRLPAISGLNGSTASEVIPASGAPSRSFHRYNPILTNPTITTADRAMSQVLCLTGSRNDE